MADAADSKSAAGDSVRVQVPPSAARKKPLLSVKTREVFSYFFDPKHPERLICAFCVHL